MDILTLLFFKLNAVVVPLFFDSRNSQALLWQKKFGRRIEEHMGITRNMIRRYEKKGVISKNEEGKDREFDEEGLRQLWDIRMLVRLGFSLDEVKEILSEGNLKELSQRKLGELDKKCEDLQSKKDLLNIVQITGELPCCLEDVIDEFGKKSE